MSTVGENIKKLRISRGLGQQDVAEIVGAKTYTTVSKWESGDNFPRGRDIILLCKYFNVSADGLLGLTDLEISNPASEYPLLPVYAAAGIPETVDGLQEDGIESIVVPDALMGRWAGSKDIYFIRVNGESMNNVLPDGSTAAVKKVEMTEIKNGDIVLFSNDGEYSIKRFSRNDDYVVFTPDSNNPAFSSQIFPVDSEINIHGKVVMYTTILS